MKHPQKPPKAFSALVIGALGFTLASAFIYVSAAPTKVTLQNDQPTISKIGLVSSDAKGKTTASTYDWTGKPVAIKYSSAISKLEMSAQTTGNSAKAPVWYAFDSFSLVSKVITPAMIEKMALADAPDANSSLWQKGRSAVVSNAPLEKDEKRVLVVYVSNADPKSVMNKGIVDALAYIVVQDGTTELQGPSTSTQSTLWINSSKLNVDDKTYVMGATQKELYSFDVAATKEEDLKLDRFAVQFKITSIENSGANLLGAVKNIRLMNGNKAVGSTITSLFALKNSPGSVGQAIFTNVNFVVPKGEKRTLTVVADIASMPEIYSGAAISLSTTTDLVAEDGLPGITAVGVKSGAAAKIQTNAPTNLVNSGKVVTIYLTSLSTMLAANSPGGASSKNNGQPIAKFVVANLQNVNNQAAHPEKLKITVNTNIQQPMGAVRVLKVFKGEAPIGSNLLGSFEFSSNTCLLGSGCVAEIDLTSKNGQLDIEAGSSQIYTVTLDTVDALSNNQISANIGISQWSDGVTSGISSVNPKMTVTSKNLVY